MAVLGIGGLSVRGIGIKRLERSLRFFWQFTQARTSSDTSLTVHLMKQLHSGLLSLILRGKYLFREGIVKYSGQHVHLVFSTFLLIQDLENCMMCLCAVKLVIYGYQHEQSGESISNRVVPTFDMVVRDGSKKW
jgi:hypothetical protein